MSVRAEFHLDAAERALDEEGENAVTFALLSGAAALVEIAKSLSRIERELQSIRGAIK